MGSALNTLICRFANLVIKSILFDLMPSAAGNTLWSNVLSLGRSFRPYCYSSVLQCLWNYEFLQCEF